MNETRSELPRPNSDYVLPTFTICNRKGESSGYPLTGAVGVHALENARPAKEKVKVPKRLYLTPDEAKRLTAAAGKRGRNPTRDRLMIQTMYRHGMRASEVCELRWADINLDEGTMFVRRKKMGKDSTHTMHRDEIGQLRKLRKTADGVYVFLSELGSPMTVDALQYVVRAAGKACGMPDAHPHMLRHAAGYMLVNDGVDMRLIQDYLGHKTAAMTVHYTAISPKRLAAVRVR